MLKILHYFFPWETYNRAFEESLSIWWVIITILFGVGSFIFLYLKIEKIKKQLIQSATEIDKERNLFDSLLNNSLLGPSWKRYRETFLATEGNAVKTVVDASLFFNFEDLLSHKINIRYWQSIPSILVGFGILGTFVGLVVGVSGFHSGTVDEIKDSIQVLLGGMSTAFITSIWGMLLSLLFGVLEKWRFNRLEFYIKGIASKFNDLFYLSNVSEFGVYRDDEGNPVYPSYVLRDLRNNSFEQTKALKSFSTDLADGIKISTQTIEEMGDRIGRSVEKSILESLEPILARISTAVEALNEEKKKDTGEYIGGITGELKQFFEEMTEKFSGAATQNLTEAADQMKSVAESIKDSSQLFTDLLTSISALSDSIQQGSQEYEIIKENSFKDLLNGMQSSFLLIADELKNVTTSILGKTLESSEKTNKNLEDLLEKIQDVYEHLSEIQKISIENNIEFLKKSDHYIESLGVSADSLNEASEITKQSTKNINATMEIFKNQSELFNSEFKEILIHINQSLSLAQTVSTDYSTKFRIIEEGLSGIFDKINMGLVNYQNGVTKNLNDTLGEFAEHLRTAVNTLSAVVEELYAIGENQIKSSRKS